MKHILYKTTNTINNKFYIGVHSCKGNLCYHTKGNKGCTYLGSGTSIKQAIKKYGKANFTRQTLQVCASREELFKAEKLIVNPSNPLSYNQAEGGQGHHKFDRKGKITLYRGVTYPSVKALALSKGTSPEHASKWVRGLVVEGASNSKPVNIAGIQYRTQTEASVALGSCITTIKKLATGGTCKQKIRQVLIQGVAYKTTGEASKALGLSSALIGYRCNSKTRKFKDYNFTYTYRLFPHTIKQPTGCPLQCPLSITSHNVNEQ
ncbi:MAG: hypothetical protein L3J61_01695 [Ghiorsea sp.]|nr:hypothetical protein [Ghiorsea sp.]